MKTSDLQVFQPIDSSVFVILIAVVILAVGYGFYRRMKLSEKER